MRMLQWKNEHRLRQGPFFIFSALLDVTTQLSCIVGYTNT